MAVKSSTTERLNDRDTIAPNVDERPKAGGTAADSASQAVSALTADEGTGRAAYQAGMGPGKSIRRRSNINFGLLLSSVPTPTLPKLSNYSGAYAIAGTASRTHHKLWRQPPTRTRRDASGGVPRACSQRAIPERCRRAHQAIPQAEGGQDHAHCCRIAAR